MRALAGRFIVGATAAGATATLERMWRDGCASSVDLLGEATVTRAEGAAYADRCEQALARLARAAAGWPARPLLEQDGLGRLPRVNLSVKVTALTPLVRAQAPWRGRDDAATHLRRLLRRARELDAHLHVDMESLDARELVLDTILEVLAEREFAAGPSAGVVLQAYLVDADETLDQLLAWTRASDRAAPLTIRLVKGAYWDHETIEALRHGWPSPVWREKDDSDRCFERLTRTLIAARAEGLPVRPAIASHNLRSVAHALVVARRAGLGLAGIELQVLRGLGDELASAAAREGLRPRVYAPVGDLVAGWRTSSAGCWRTARTSRSSPVAPRAPTSTGCWRRHELPQRAPPGAAPRPRARRAARGAAAARRDAAAEGAGDDRRRAAVGRRGRRRRARSVG